MGCDTSNGRWKSPPHKLIAFFFAGREKWKAKAQEAKRQLKASRIQSERRGESRDRWRDAAMKAQNEAREAKARLLEAEKELHLVREAAAQKKTIVSQCRTARLKGHGRSDTVTVRRRLNAWWPAFLPR